MRNSPTVSTGGFTHSDIMCGGLPRVCTSMGHVGQRVRRLGRLLGREGWETVLGRGALGKDFSLYKGKLRAKLGLALAFGPTPRGRKCGVRHVSLSNHPVVSTVTRGMIRAAHNAILKQKRTGYDAIRRTLTTLCTVKISGYLLRIGKPRFPVVSNDTRVCIRGVGHMNVTRRSTIGSCCVVHGGLRMGSRRANSYVAVLPSRRFDVATVVTFRSGILSDRFTALSGVRGFRARVTPYHAFIFMHRVRRLLTTKLVGNNSLSGTVIVCRRRVSRRGLSDLTSGVNIPRRSTGRGNCLGRGPLT